MAKKKRVLTRDPVSGIVYNIPTPEEAKQLMAEGRELRRKLQQQLAPMSRIDAEFLGRRVK